MNKNCTLSFYLNYYVIVLMVLMFHLGFGQQAPKTLNPGIPNNSIFYSTASRTKNWTNDHSDSATASGKTPLKPTISSTLRASYSFISNIGQYGETMKGYEQMGVLRYGYEGLDMPVLFTPKGLIYLHRKYERISHAEEERLEKQGVREEEIERKLVITDRVITMEWVGSNPNVEIIAEDKTTDYHTYGMLQGKAYGYQKLTYKNLYPGIDLIYSFTHTNKLGFEYSLLAQPGADLSVVQLKYGGDVKKIKLDRNGNLIIKSDIDGIMTTVPVSYYGKQLMDTAKGTLKSAFQLVGKQVHFYFPEGYDPTKALVIDPFVTSTNNLTGANAGKAIDVDYDYNGNVYVAGGGNLVSTFAAGASHKHAKYNSAGGLEWTFNGVLTIPSWQADFYYGGWVVDKATGNLYIGQGYATAGFRVIRLNTTGLYDNYISTGNPSFQEAWKMYWVCNNGSPQIICAGGGTSGPTNFAYCTPPSTTLSAAVNLTGSPAIGQDMTDLIVDPVTNSLYTIYASPLDPTTANKVFKHNTPYNFASTAWSTATGYTGIINELANRPYLATGYNDNSSNILGQNASYIFYWDGQHLKAFDKTTGAITGTPISIVTNGILMEGGVVADACDNVYIGNTNGTIKVYKFDGTTFDDAGAPDIIIPGHTTNVYDLALDESKKLLFASGDGFVASIDVAAYCPATIYTVTVASDCSTASASASISPAPPANSTVSYTLFDGTTPLAVITTTGSSPADFTGLNPNITYTVVATVNSACSGLQATTDFVLPGPIITYSQTDTTCGANTGAINATGSGTPGPYTYSLDGGAFQPSGIFTGLAAGIHTLIVKGAGGCPNDTTVNIVNSNGPLLTFTKTDATCGSNTGTVTATATGGTAPYQYSISGVVSYSYQLGNFFTGLVAGDYILTVKDATNCTNSELITITTSAAVLLNAIPAAATCGQNNGTITAFGSGGISPLQYSIDGNIFQAGTIFSNITPGSYTVYVKDAIGCLTSVTVTVGNVTAPTVTATAIGSTCNNINGSITATGSDGVLPYQFSRNGGLTYQTGNVFTGLAPGLYTITIKDATGCTNTVSVTITNTNGPSLTVSTTISSCAASTGSITATGSGGLPGYQFSNNGGITYQASGVFSNLSPGNYIVLIRDANGCIGTAVAIVGAVSGPSIAATTTAASCTVNDGTITANGTGGTAPLQYSIDGVTYQGSGLFINRAPGFYTVYVKDANGCIKTTTVIVTSASGLALTVSVINSSCSAGNGLLTATATGGTAPLQYSIDGVTYQSSNVFINPSPGTYTVYVKDAGNCIVTKQATVTAVNGITFSLTVQKQATCNGANGVILVTAVGGVAPLTYSIDNGAFQAIPIFPAVAAGVHTVKVQDATGCITAAQSVTITNSGSGSVPSNLTFKIVDAVGCIGGGRIKNLKGFPSGGGTSYEFSLDGGPFTSSNQFTPVTPGYHTVTTRVIGSTCSITKVAFVGVGETATASATSTSSACGSSTGTITLTGVGVAPFHASIDNGVTWVTFNTTTTYTGLAPATYAIIIADDGDYIAGPPVIPGACLTTIYVTVGSTGGPTISTTQVNPSCIITTGSITAIGGGGTGSYTYSIDGGPYTATNIFTNLTAGNHAVSVKDGTGCINGVTIPLISVSVPSVTAAVENASCGLYNGSITATAAGGVAPLEYSIDGTVFQSSPSFTDLLPGNYSLYVRDANGCFSSIPIIIANSPLPVVTAYTVAATCNNADGMIVALGSFGETPYTYSIDGIAYQSSSTFTTLAAGFYTVYIQDARGCTTTTGVTIANSGAPTFTSSVASAKCGDANGSITLTAASGSGNYEYSGDGGLSYQTSTLLSPLSPGAHAVVIRDTTTGCVVSQSILVPNTDGPHTLTATVVSAACDNADGSITATALGGTPPYHYSIDGVTYQLSNSITNVLAGTYTLYVRDASLCIKTLPVTVSNLLAPTVSTMASPTSCGLSDGTITVTATGGTVQLSYSIDGGTTYQASNIFTGLAEGTYTIVVKDARNCLSEPEIVAITAVGSTITPTFAAIAPICAGDALAALPTSSTNASPITGTWSPALDNTTTTTYTFTPDAGQCATSTSLEVTVNPILSPIISCGTVSPSSVTFTWGTVSGATGYDVSYQVNSDPIVTIGAIGTALTYSITSLNENDVVALTITPTGGTGSCFAAATSSCSATTCTPPMGSIGADQTICSGGTATFSVALSGTAPWNITYTDGTTPTTVTNVTTNPYVFTVSGITTSTSYTLTALSDANCSSTPADLTGSATVSVITGIAGLWTGLVSTDWFDCRNWAGGLPTPTINAQIPAGVVRMPLIDPATSPYAILYNNIADAQDVLIAPTASLTMAANSDLYVSRDWNNSGLFIPGQGTVTLTGATPNQIQTLNQGIKTNETFYNLTLNTSNGALGVSLVDGYELTVSNLLSLESGDIRLTGEAQIVQAGLVANPTSGTGKIYRDQQGTRSSYNYNYWSSPVSANSIDYRVGDVLRDGSDVATSPFSPTPITFGANAYFADGAPSNPIKISDYWIFKYTSISTLYADWQPTGSAGTIKVAEGYTMKGTDGIANITDSQNYVFAGKPNNGTYTLGISPNQTYLVGNPYPSAMDADEFIKDNIKDGPGRNATNVINGALYYWNHFAGHTHVLAAYIGGYATYTLMGGVNAISNDVLINNNGAIGTLVPKKYIPVAQGFFVGTTLDPTLIANNPNLTTAVTGGPIVFKNSQRAFKVESPANSVFMKMQNTSTSSAAPDGDDVRPKIRLLFDSANGLHRQLLVGVDEQATDLFDLGYDAPIIDVNSDDMYWDFSGNKFVIQALPDFNTDRVIPLSMKITTPGKVIIRIDALEHISDTTELYLYDNLTGIYHDLRTGDFIIGLAAGTYEQRFSLRFAAQYLGIDTPSYNPLLITYTNLNHLLTIRNNDATTTVKKVYLFNLLGQLIATWDVENKPMIQLPIQHLSQGTYIVKVKTSNQTVSRKILLY